MSRISDIDVSDLSDSQIEDAVEEYLRREYGAIPGSELTALRESVLGLIDEYVPEFLRVYRADVQRRYEEHQRQHGRRSSRSSTQDDDWPSAEVPEFVPPKCPWKVKPPKAPKRGGLFGRRR